MVIRHKNLPLHLCPVETAQGFWVIFVKSVSESESGDTLFLKLVLEQTLGEGERFRARQLAMVVPPSKLHDPKLFEDIQIKIHEWLETTEGDGFLDLVNC